MTLWIALLVAQVWLPATLAFSQIQQKAVDMWILGNQPESEHRKRILKVGDQKLVEIKNVLAAGEQPLSAEQEAKIQLALEGVASRALQDIAQLRASTDHLDVQDREQQQKALQILAPAMQQRQGGWFGKQSLFFQMLDKTLTEDQQGLLAHHRQEFAKRSRHAAILGLVAKIDERTQLLKAQRDKLVELIEQQRIKELPESYEPYAPILCLLRVSDKELEALLDPKQVEAVRAMTARYQNIEAALR